VPAISTRDFALRRECDLDRALDFVAILRAPPSTLDQGALRSRGQTPWA